MSGWGVFGALALVAVGALWGLGMPRAIATFAAAAVLLAAAGFVRQAAPALAGRPAVARTVDRAIDPADAALRGSMIDLYTADAAYLTASDAMARYGDPRAAVRVILGGIGHFPQSHVLWSELGATLAAHDHVVSPAARFAFARAAALAPLHPAPWFRLGLAHATTGDLPAARTAWLQALSRSPARAGYRRQIALRVGLLDLILARRAR